MNVPYIVVKAQILDGVYTETPIGYVVSKEDLDTIQSTHGFSDFKSWVFSNDAALQSRTKDVSEFFVGKDVIYGGDWYSTDTYNLPLITNLNSPEAA
jgi:sulfur relay (sulfurtransferase) DsrF/TusC family protein